MFKDIFISRVYLEQIEIKKIKDVINMDYTLISTIYSIEPIMVCITQFSPKKVVLLREEDAPPGKTQS